MLKTSWFLWFSNKQPFPIALQQNVIRSLPLNSTMILAPLRASNQRSFNVSGEGAPEKLSDLASLSQSHACKKHCLTPASNSPCRSSATRASRASAPPSNGVMPRTDRCRRVLSWAATWRRESRYTWRERQSMGTRSVARSRLHTAAASSHTAVASTRSGTTRSSASSDGPAPAWLDSITTPRISRGFNCRRLLSES